METLLAKVRSDFLDFCTSRGGTYKLWATSVENRFTAYCVLPESTSFDEVIDFLRKEDEIIKEFSRRKVRSRIKIWHVYMDFKAGDNEISYDTDISLPKGGKKTISVHSKVEISNRLPESLLPPYCRCDDKSCWCIGVFDLFDDFEEALNAVKEKLEETKRRVSKGVMFEKSGRIFVEL